MQVMLLIWRVLHLWGQKCKANGAYDTINHFDCNFDKSLLISKILSTATFIPPHVQQMQRDGRNFSDSTTQTQLWRQSIASNWAKTVLLGAHGERRSRDAEGVEFEAPRVEKPKASTGGKWGGGIPLTGRLEGLGELLGERRKLPQQGPVQRILAKKNDFTAF